MARIKEKKKVQLLQEGNQLAESSFDLSTLAQKTFDYLCFKINHDEDIVIRKNNDGDTWVQFNISGEYCQLLGVDYHDIYKNVKIAIRKLRETTIIIINKESKKEVVTGLINQMIFDNKDCFCEIQISQYLMPYIKNMTERYTTYDLKYLMSFDSKYAIRLYKLLKERYDCQIAGKDNRNVEEKKSNPAVFETEITLEELKDKFKFKYDDAYDVKRYVIEPAIKEINEKSDIIVKYKKVKSYGKTVFIFEVKLKDIID